VRTSPDVADRPTDTHVRQLERRSIIGLHRAAPLAALLRRPARRHDGDQEDNASETGQPTGFYTLETVA